MMQKLNVIMKLYEGNLLKVGLITNVIGDLHQYKTNTQNQVNRMIGNMARKQARIGVLVQEKFALQLLYQRNAHHLQRSRGDIGLLEFNQDRLYERYEKWKNKTQAERQNNLNLQRQILAFQNNPLNIQQIGMVGYRPQYFMDVLAKIQKIGLERCKDI